MRRFKLNEHGVVALIMLAAFWITGIFDAKRPPPDLETKTKVEGVFVSTYVNKGKFSYTRHEVQVAGRDAIRVQCFDGQYGDRDGCPNLHRFDGKKVVATVVDGTGNERGKSPRLKLLATLEGPPESGTYVNQHVSEWQGGKGRVTAFVLIAFVCLISKLLTPSGQKAEEAASTQSRGG